jgi:CBS domain containing-hemolysin-like protein
MVPRPDVVAVPDGMPLRELFFVTAQGGHTRYPVHEDDSLDRIVGAVHIRDVMSTVAAEGLEAPITARDLARDVLVVPENRPIDEILKDLQNQQIQMAIVIDEWGSFEGLITIEDIIEELVGEIRDQFDEEEEPAIRERPDGSWLVDGMLAADELKERLGLGELPREEEADYQTVGGMVMDTLGRVPSTGDRFEWEGYSFEVVDMDGRRVDKVLVTPTRNAAEAAS